ncbi:hypothetical protein NIES2107_30550 [Nostoc carneum NIES-2107]|nr:hypothetical protein NIES2107_30550 [Nostoc carneum NIES-2107]
MNKQIIKTEIDNDELWISLIFLILDKVKKGIQQGTWKYEYHNNYDIHENYLNEFSKAVNASYTVELDIIRECYDFTVNDGNKKMINIYCKPFKYAALCNLSKYLDVLKHAQDEFFTNQKKILEEEVLNIVSQLPD